MVTVARARHSVPVTYVGRMLRSECFVERIETFDGPTRVAVHQRSYERGATALDLAHYLDAFEHKPRAALSGANPIFTVARRAGRIAVGDLDRGPGLGQGVRVPGGKRDRRIRHPAGHRAGRRTDKRADGAVRRSDRRDGSRLRACRCRPAPPDRARLQAKPDRELPAIGSGGARKRPAAGRHGALAALGEARD